MKRPVSKPKGFALAMTLIIVALVAIVTFTSVNISTLDQKASTQEIIATQAAYAARAGISHAQTEVGKPGLNRGWSGTGGGSITGPERWIDQDLGIGYATRVEWNNGIVWRVTSTGFFRNAQRTLVAYMEDEPFSKYAYFTDRDVSSAGTEIWFTTGNLIDGPAHTNGHFRMAGFPEWSDAVSSANLEDSRFQAGPPQRYNQHGVQTDNRRFYQTYSSYNNDRPIRAGGNPNQYANFAGGQDEIPLPETTGIIADAAQAAGTQFVDSGNQHSDDQDEYDYRINVEDDNTSGRVTSYERRRKPDGSWQSTNETRVPPVFRLTFRDNGTAVVEKKRIGTSSTWDAVDTVNTTTQPGVTMHFDGFVLIKGTVNGRVTVGSTQDMHNIDNLVYNDENQDVLGIVGQENFVVESDNNRDRDRRIHATIMTLNGSFYVDHYNQGSPRGLLKVFGGLIQRNRGAVGTFRYVNGVPQSNTGYEKDYEYDEKLLARPPVNFPNTGEMQVTQLIDQGAPGGL